MESRKVTDLIKCERKQGIGQKGRVNTTSRFHFQSTLRHQGLYLIYKFLSSSEFFSPKFEHIFGTLSKVCLIFMKMFFPKVSWWSSQLRFYTALIIDWKRISVTITSIGFHLENKKEIRNSELKLSRRNLRLRYDLIKITQREKETC